MAKQRLLNIVTILFSFIVIALELYPKGIVMEQVINPEESITTYYSYFSMTLYWKENWYPLQIALLTLCMVLFIFVRFIRYKHEMVFYNLMSLLGMLSGTMALLSTVHMMSMYNVTWVTYAIGITIVITLLCITIGIKRSNNYE